MQFSFIKAQEKSFTTKYKLQAISLSNFKCTTSACLPCSRKR